VARLTPFGVFVEVGDGVEGMIHITELAGHSVRHPEDVVKPGSFIQAIVLRVDVSEKKIGLSRKRVPSE
jgi:small subunit ribosomal protein S1